MIARHFVATLALVTLASPAVAVEAPQRAFLGGSGPPVGLVPVDPPGIGPRAEPPGRTRRSPCVDTDRIAGATVLGDRTIELLLAGGARRRLHFADDCPFPGFYGGFYYRRNGEGRLCAGRDAILSRAGGDCAITKITRQRQPRRRR